MGGDHARAGPMHDPVEQTFNPRAGFCELRLDGFARRRGLEPPEPGRLRAQRRKLSPPQRRPAPKGARPPSDPRGNQGHCWLIRRDNQRAKGPDRSGNRRDRFSCRGAPTLTQISALHRAIFRVSSGRYSAPGIHAELVAQGERIVRKTAAKLTKDNDVRPPRRRRIPRTTDCSAQPVDRAEAAGPKPAGGDPEFGLACRHQPRSHRRWLAVSRRGQGRGDDGVHRPFGRCRARNSPLEVSSVQARTARQGSMSDRLEGGLAIDGITTALQKRRPRARAAVSPGSRGQTCRRRLSRPAGRAPRAGLDERHGKVA